MLYQLLKLNRLKLILGAIIIIGLFAFVQITKAADVLVDTQSIDNDSIGFCNERTVWQSFKSSGFGYPEDIFLKLVCGNCSIWDVDHDVEFSITDEDDDIVWDVYYPSIRNLISTTGPAVVKIEVNQYANTVFFDPNETYKFNIDVNTSSSCPSTPTGWRVDHTDVYADGRASWNASYDHWLKINGDDIGVGEVDIADITEWDEITVTTEAETLLYEDEKLCFVDYPCTYRIWYSGDEIGSFAGIIKQWYTGLANADDYVLELPGFDTINSLKYDFDLELQTSATTTEYYLVVLGDSTSTRNLYPFTVNWIASSTDDLTQVSWIMKTFKNIFPISIILQIKEVFDSNTSTSSTQLININLQDIIPVEHSGFSASGTILSSDLVNSNFSLWQELIYPWIKYFLWLITFVYIIIRMRNLATSSDTG